MKEARGHGATIKLADTNAIKRELELATSLPSNFIRKMNT